MEFYPYSKTNYLFSKFYIEQSNYKLDINKIE